MPTVPRDEIDAVMARHGDRWGMPGDPTIEDVRLATDEFRQQEEARFDAMADDLDALADRYETETR